MRRRRCWGAVLAAAALACASEDGPPLAERSPHVIESTRLREEMRELAWLSRTRMPIELDVDIEVAHQREDVVRVADALAVAARSLAESTPPAYFSGTEAERFRAVAIELREASLALARDARAAEAKTLARDFDRLKKTCDRCHSELRDVRLGR